jgi:hypothetical protein
MLSFAIRLRPWARPTQALQKLGDQQGEATLGAAFHLQRVSLGAYHRAASGGAMSGHSPIASRCTKKAQRVKTLGQSQSRWAGLCPHWAGKAAIPRA